jgi:hypothetical protein
MAIALSALIVVLVLTALTVGAPSAKHPRVLGLYRSSVSSELAPYKAVTAVRVQARADARTARRHRAERRRDRQAAAMPAPVTATPIQSYGGYSGNLDCGELEALWEAAGGPAGEAQLAASVAMAESGGNQFAVSPDGANIGYWQINAPSWGSLASTDPMTNAKAAVMISHGGSDFSPWTTYTSGAYAGRC